MTTKYTAQALETMLFDTWEKSKKVGIEDFGSWLLHRAYRPDEFGQEMASNCITAWDLFREFKRENGI